MMVTLPSFTDSLVVGLADLLPDGVVAADLLQRLLAHLHILVEHLDE